MTFRFDHSVASDAASYAPALQCRGGCTFTSHKTALCKGQSYVMITLRLHKTACYDRYMSFTSMWQWFRDVNPWRGMMLSMVIFVLYGVYALGDSQGALRVLLIVVPVGLALDYFLHYFHATERKQKFPESGLITSLIVSVLMPLSVDWRIAVASVCLAILSKHFIRFRGEHVFNPASFGVLVVSLFVAFPLAWWPDGYIWLAIILGLLNLWRTRKYAQAVSFLVPYFAFLFIINQDVTIAALTLPFFFICFMLPEPVTSQGGWRGQITFGLIAGIGAILVSYAPQIGSAALPAGLLLANLSRYLWRDPAPKYALTPGFAPQK